MANTTFKGPVRSENGFQEWDGSAWVPVAGGGGGGEVMIVPAAGGETYTLNFTEVGQMITVVVRAIPGAELGTITLDATAPGNPTATGTYGIVIDAVTRLNEPSPTEFPYTLDFSSYPNMFLQFVYTGTFETPYGTQAIFEVSGHMPLPA
jgi:hypothetical protein